MELIKHLPELLSGSDWIYLTRIQTGVDLKDKPHHRLQLVSGVEDGAGCGEMKRSGINALLIQQMDPKTHNSHFCVLFHPAHFVFLITLLMAV